LQIAPEGRLTLAQDAVRSKKSWVLPRNLTQPRQGRLIFSQGGTLGPGSLQIKSTMHHTVHRNHPVKKNSNLSSSICMTQMG
ncbi:MAG TPA: hypothetical protein VHW43_11210, partial [Puia sp.]|nr:hypothetical protein [Puia sp.]